MLRLNQQQLEALLVASVLILIATFSGGKFTDWSGALAVFIGFIHSQLCLKLASEVDANQKQVPNFSSRRVLSLLVAKETIWIITFASLGNMPLLAGAFIFMTYPSWRKLIPKNTNLIVTVPQS